MPLHVKCLALACMKFDWEFDFVLQQHLLFGVSSWRGERAGKLVSQPADSWTLPQLSLRNQTESDSEKSEKNTQGCSNGNAGGSWLQLGL